MLNESWIEKEVAFKEIDSLLQAGYEVEIDSPDGFVGVNCFVDKGEWVEYKLTLSDHREVSVNENHLFETINGWEFAKDLCDGEHTFLTNTGYVVGKVNKSGNIIPIVDINVNHKNHRYYANGISSHNTAVGKSTFLSHLACSYFMQGYNVFYGTFEMSRERTAARFDANLLNIPINDLNDLPKSSFDNAMKKIMLKTPGKLIVEEYPTSSVNMLHVAHTLDELQLKRNFIPDVIILDYLNIILSHRIKVSNSGTYAYIKYVAEEMRAMAVLRNVPIWTATQLNREGFRSSDVGLENTSESFGIPVTADLMVALISTEELEAQNQILLKQLKNRYNDSAKDRRIILGIDRPRMRFYEVSEAAQNQINQDVSDLMKSENSNNMIPMSSNKFSDFNFS